MTITTGLSLATVELPVGAVALFTVPSSERYVVTAVDLFNDGIDYATITAETGGKSIGADWIIGVREPVSATELVGHGYAAGEDLTLTTDIVGVTVRLTYNRYTGANAV